MTTLLRHMYRWAATAIAVCGLSLSCQKADDTPEEPEEPTTYEVQVEDFSTTRETMHIGGKLYLPKGRKGPGPAAIFCHGLFGSRNEQEVYARCAARVGIIAVAFDFCGGPANGSLSDGTPADNSVLTEIEDVTAVYDALASRADVDPSRIVVMGASQGGLVSALFAAKYPSRVKALGLFFPAFNLPDYVRTGVKTLFDDNLDAIPEEGLRTKLLGIDLGDVNYTFSPKYIRDAYGIDAYRTIGNYKGTVNIIHGDQDIIVPIEYTQEALKVYKNAHLDVLPGQGHVFDQTGIDKATAILQKWFPTVL